MREVYYSLNLVLKCIQYYYITFIVSRSRNLDSLAIPADGNLSNAASGGGNNSGPLLDIGETNSEAWSMDVLASDTESFRMRDFDPDDSISVARSDDTRNCTFSFCLIFINRSS